MDTTMLGETGGRLLIAILGVGLGMLVLVGALWWMKNRPSSPFIRGGASASRGWPCWMPPPSIRAAASC